MPIESTRYDDKYNSYEGTVSGRIEGVNYLQHLSELNNDIYAKCDSCEHVFKIERDAVVTRDYGYELCFPYTCDCGSISSKIQIDSSKQAEYSIIDIATRYNNQQNVNSSFDNDNSIDSLCNLLNIPNTTLPDDIIRACSDLSDRWDPERFIDDPNKYFEAQKISKRLNEACDYARKQLNIDTVEGGIRMTKCLDAKIVNNGDQLNVKCLECGKSLSVNSSQISIESDGHVTFNTGGCPCGNDLHFTINDSGMDGCNNIIQSNYSTALLIANIIGVVMYSVALFKLLSTTGNRYILSHYVGGQYFVAMFYPLIPLVLSLIGILRMTKLSVIFSIIFYVLAIYIVFTFNSSIIKYDQMLPNPYLYSAPLFK